MTGIQISIDRGGTFSDFIARIPGQQDYVFKLLSVDPKNYADAPTEGIRLILEKAHGVKIPRSQKLKLDSIESIRMGTTVATNALLERKGADVCLLTTKGFKDVLTIGNQTRPNIFDLTAKKLGHLQKKVIEIDERVTIAGFSEGGGDKLPIEEGDLVVDGATGDKIKILKVPDYQQVEKDLQQLYDEGQFKVLALCLVNSYAYPEHESKIADICEKIGFQVSVSHKLQPMIGIVNRASSTVADAYLTPAIKEYIDGFCEGFEGGIDAFGNKLLFMQSNGGLCPWYKFTGLKAILSGPAGGMVGFGETCYDHVTKKATIGFDAGGTSTDVARYSGALEHIYETVVSQVSLQTPQLDISTVAAGGGSMLFWKNGIFVVGPESAGSDPGPACYRKGGPLTVTDANLFLGRLIPEYFPKIFGPNQDQPLDYDITAKKFKELTEEINQDEAIKVKFTPEEVAVGFLNVAVESMARPIRTITESKGYGTSEHNLACFGGSGGQFAISLAKNLGISDVAIHKYSSILSAYGIFLADIVIEKQSPTNVAYDEQNFKFIDQKTEELISAAKKDYVNQGLTAFDTRTETYLNMRFVGSDTHLLISKDMTKNDAADRFIDRHRKEFGFTLDRGVIVDDIQVLLVVESKDKQVHNPYEEFRKLKPIDSDEQGLIKSVYFEKVGWSDTKILQLKKLKVGSKIIGPAIILDETQTLLVEPNSTANILTGHVLIEVEQEVRPELSSSVIDPIQLSVFGHRFMSIAEQMGRTLQQTAISTNIKERLDFSCAIFDKEASLVANAPHVPIHLGSMSFAVKKQLEMYRKVVDGKEVFDLKPGDVLVTNHPSAGGSHLPDVTVITPVLDKDNIPIFWVASRGHHADIGSISAGSMPSDSKTIFDEGASIVTHKLCVEGEFDEAGVKRLFYDEPAKYPGGSGSRALNDNISDLKAQASANYKGIVLLQNLVNEFTEPVINLYMKGIQSTAEIAVRNLLKLAYKKFKGKELKAVEYLDDGTALALTISIDPETGDAVFDFTESGDEMYGNLNAPKAIVYSAILYVLRSLISSDIPLNNGCLIPITLETRKGSVVDPSFEAAVVGGNVETTQRVIDVVLKAFEAAAGSQGTCNNLTFGIADDKVKFGYYETICGGAGAVEVDPTSKERKHGQSAVQVHTTNTRMTDTEIFEKRYPVIVHQYTVRNGSGGDGYYKGGDGVIREIEFTYPNLQITCLMERRSLPPFGMKGGQDGFRGKNIWLQKTKDGYKPKSLAGKSSVKVAKGDRIIIMTPGGGGFGSPDYMGDEVNYPIKSETSIYTGSVAMRNMIQQTN